MDTIEIHAQSLHLTDDQFFSLCANNKELNFERDNNKNIIIMSPVGFLSSWYEGKIFRMLDQWNEKTGLGYVTGSSGGYFLPNSAMRAPDVAWIEKSRIDCLPLEEKEKFPHLCPDFVIELRSKSDSLKQLQTKMNEWMENGCRLAWLIDIENKHVHIYRKSSKAGNIMNFKDKISGEEVLPGFELNLDELA